MPARNLLLYAVVGIAAAVFSAGAVLVVRGNAPTPAADDADEGVVAAPPPADAKPAAAKKAAAKPAVPATAWLDLPKDGGVWPWPVKAAPPEAPTVPLSLTKLVVVPGSPFRTLDVHSARVNPSVGRAVVTLTGFDPKGRPKGEETWGVLVLCDLTAGTVLQKWETKKALTAYDIHRDGKQFLARHAHAGYDLDTQTIELWQVKADGTVRRRPWRPYSDDRKVGRPVLGVDESKGMHVPEAQVKWAGFVGPNHVATVHGTKLKVWDTGDLREVAEFPGVVGLPAVTPDGDRLAFLTGESVALLDPAAGKVVSARRIAPPKDPVLCFHPDGQKLAAVGTGRTRILDLVSGRVTDAMMAEIDNKSNHDWADLPPPCGWAGDKHVFFKGQLYDLDMPVPVWHYSWSKWAAVAGRRLWAVADNPSDGQVVLRPFTVPHPGMQAKVHQLLLTSDVFALRPGNSVTVDVAGLPADRRADVKATVEKRLRALGYKTDGGQVTFRATVDKTPSKGSAAYMNGTVIKYDAHYAHLEAVKAGKVIWSTAGTQEPPFTIPYSMTSGFYKDYGAPNYAIFAEHPIPGVIRSDGKRGSLGSSSFRANGIEDR